MTAELETKVVAVTPEIAADWLNQNYEHNRPLSSPRIDRYAADMRAGRWMLTHQGIAFGHDGKLFDGQHRLYAVIESGCTVDMNVTWGVSEESYVVMDRGGVRSISDVAQDDRITKITVAVARAMMFGVDTGGSIVRGKYDTRDPQTVIPFLINNWPVIAKAFAHRPTRGSVSRLYPAQVMAALATAFHHKTDDELDGFLAAYATGQYANDAEHSAFLLREWILSTQTVTMRRDVGATIYRKTQKAIDAYCRGGAGSRIRVSDDDLFPLPESAWDGVPVVGEGALKRHRNQKNSRAARVASTELAAIKRLTGDRAPVIPPTPRKATTRRATATKVASKTRTARKRGGS